MSSGTTRESAQEIISEYLAAKTAGTIEDIVHVTILSEHWFEAPPAAGHECGR
jgi:hypothetical protein